VREEASLLHDIPNGCFVSMRWRRLLLNVRMLLVVQLLALLEHLFMQAGFMWRLRTMLQ
jgi:hypothetical protein